MSTADTLLFSFHAGGWLHSRRQPTFTINGNVSTRNLSCTNLDRQKQSLSHLHHKQPNSRMNTQTHGLHHQRLAHQLCAPTSNCPSCKRRRGIIQLCQQAVSARPQLRLLLPILCIGQAPSCCTRGRTWSSGSK